MEKSGLVETRDVRAILGMVNALFELPDDPEARGAHLLTEICRFFGARSGMTALLHPAPRAGESLMRWGVAGGFLDASDIRLYDRYASEAHMRDLMLTRIIAEDRANGVHPRGACVPDPTWYNSAHFNEMRIPLGIDDALYAFWPVPGVPLVAAIGFNRELHGGAFSQRDWNLAAILHDALVPFYRYLYRSQRGQVHPRLTPREREVYRELKTGLSEKEIAVRLGISRHTVHDHVKRIYVAFGVSGRAELLTRE